MIIINQEINMKSFKKVPDHKVQKFDDFLISSGEELDKINMNAIAWEIMNKFNRSDDEKSFSSIPNIFNRLKSHLETLKYDVDEYYKMHPDGHTVYKSRSHFKKAQKNLARAFTTFDRLNTYVVTTHSAFYYIFDILYKSEMQKEISGTTFNERLYACKILIEPEMYNKLKQFNLLRNKIAHTIQVTSLIAEPSWVDQIIKLIYSIEDYKINLITHLSLLQKD
jgi:hypothetical protein